MRMIPSPDTMGTMIFTAPFNRLIPFHMRAGVGSGTINRPTPNSRVLQ